MVVVVWREGGCTIVSGLEVPVGRPVVIWWVVLVVGRFECAGVVLLGRMWVVLVNGCLMMFKQL